MLISIEQKSTTVRPEQGILYALIDHVGTRPHPYLERVFSFSVSNVIQFEHHNSYEERLQTTIAKKIAEVPEVEYIYCERQDRAYLVWVIINQLDPSARHRIYEKQRELIGRFRDENFDFYVVARLDKPPELVVNQTSMELIFSRR